ncbi:C40 family peptidase [Lactiplantibacillus plajomi]
MAGLLVTSQAVASADTMKVKAGDTVWAYSQKFNVSIDKIAEANNLSNPDLIIAGHTINIPGVKTGEKVAAKKTTAVSASSAKSTTATSASSQATSAAATSSSVTSASSSSQAVSSSKSTASASSVTSASSSSVASQASSSSVASSTSQSSVSSQASSTATSSSSQATSQSSSNNNSQAAASSSSTTYTSPSLTSANISSNYSSVIAAAKTFLGTPYEQMDCSAFTQAAFAKIGLSIGRTTYAQATLGSHVPASQAQAGDLIFWGSDSKPYHVGISLGGSSYIASPDYGETVSIKSTTYFQPSFAIHM